MTKRVWVFDVDGVITNLLTKKVTEPSILDFIVHKLELGEPVALNTGRGLEWTVENVINSIIQRVSNKKVFESFFAVGEKGGTWLTIDENERIKMNADQSLLIPSVLIKKLRDFGSKYLEKMFEYEETKRTMLSFEIRTGLPPEIFKEVQNETVPQIENIIKEEKLEKELMVDPTRIGTDIQHKKVGKGFAMERILSWLKEKRINPQKIITFGDSKSDFEMAEKAHELGFNCEFVYVGGDNVFENTKTEIPIKITKNKFEKGTLEFLKTL